MKRTRLVRPQAHGNRVEHVCRRLFTEFHGHAPGRNIERDSEARPEPLGEDLVLHLVWSGEPEARPLVITDDAFEMRPASATEPNSRTLGIKLPFRTSVRPESNSVMGKPLLGSGGCST